MALGFLNQGGTLGVRELMFVNRCTWAHVVEAAGKALDVEREALLSAEELAALDGAASPEGVVL